MSEMKKDKQPSTLPEAMKFTFHVPPGVTCFTYTVGWGGWGGSGSEDSSQRSEGRGGGGGGKHDDENAGCRNTPGT